jgi:hypothetical protein
LARLPHVPPHLRDDALRRGWNAVQVQKFLGHADPGFTLRTYVHLLPEDLPEPSFTNVSLASATEHPTADDSCARTTATISTAEDGTVNGFFHCH